MFRREFFKALLAIPVVLKAAGTAPKYFSQYWLQKPYIEQTEINDFVLMLYPKETPLLSLLDDPRKYYLHDWLDDELKPYKEI